MEDKFEILDHEEINENTIKELTNGKGDDEDE